MRTVNRYVLNMRVAYLTIKDACKLGPNSEWSGTAYYIGCALERQGIEIDYLGPLQFSPLAKAVKKIKRLFYQGLLKKRYLKDPDPLILKLLSGQAAKKLKKRKYDVVLSATVNPIAYLECDLPIVFWADATFANTANFYPEYSNLCEETLRDGHTMEQLSIEKCSSAVYSSEWAAQAAKEVYGANPAKVKVLEFGANLDNSYSLVEVKSLIAARSKEKCRLLFLGKDWVRKGGDKALEVVKLLNESGQEAELIVVGCTQTGSAPMPSYVHNVGFISKLSSEGRKELSDLIASSHFLILPTVADCSPIVFCEACSLGVPCISTEVGGIPTIVKDNINGMKFPLEASAEEYCQFISDTFSKYSSYEQLAIRAFHEYEQRLNWSVAGQTLKKILADAIALAKTQPKEY